MSRTLIDAERSLARLIARVLPDYDVWTLRTLSNEHRPYAVVKPIQIPSIRAQSVQIIDVNQPFIVYFYPEIGDTAVDGHNAKLLLEEALYQEFFTTGAPMRIPLFDYTTGGPDGTAIPWDEPGPELQSHGAVLPDGTPTAFDYLRVREYQINSAQDAEDERRWSVTLTLRLAWRRHGKLISGTPVQSFTVTPGQTT